MPRFALPLACLLLISSLAAAESPGQRALAAGRDALARGALDDGVARLAEAAALLDPATEREARAAAYLELGLAYAGRAGGDEAALAALRRSADSSARPGDAALWAAAVARRLGRAAEAAELEARALATLAAPAPPSAPTPALPAPPPVVPVPSPSPAVAPPAPAPTPGAFEHFFGAKQPTPPPAPTPPPG